MVSALAVLPLSDSKRRSAGRRQRRLKQSRDMSLVEVVADVAVGQGVAVATEVLIFPVFGLHTTLAQNLKMGAVFTVVSIARSFALRRVFEAIRMRSAK